MGQGPICSDYKLLQLCFNLIYNVESNIVIQYYWLLSVYQFWTFSGYLDCISSFFWLYEWHVTVQQSAEVNNG